MFCQIFKRLKTFQECCHVQRYYSTEQTSSLKFGVTYHKRFPDEEDPPIEKSKLFMIRRVKGVKGTPYWERNILKKLGLMGKSSEIAIVKNTPLQNADLWKIKHLIKITPITFPYGEPTEEDIGATFLQEDGKLLRAQIVHVDKARIEASEAFANDPTRMDRKIIRKQLRYQWLNPRMNGMN